jgi:tetratricopeptide (TPR) repeat protein
MKENYMSKMKLAASCSLVALLLNTSVNAGNFDKWKVPHAQECAVRGCNTPNNNPQQQPTSQDNAVAINEKGNEYFNKDDLNNALIMYEQAIIYSPNDPIIRGNANRTRALIYNGAGLKDMGLLPVRSIQLFKQALRWATSDDVLTIRKNLEFAEAVMHAQEKQARVPVEPPTVDARDVPSGLSPEMEAQIPDTPAGRWIHKAFVVINGNKNDPERWNAAHAEFGAALLEHPGDPGIQTLVELSDYMMHLKAINYPQRAMDVALPALSKYLQNHHK